jgi:hypothetical protein
MDRAEEIFQKLNVEGEAPIGEFILTAQARSFSSVSNAQPIVGKGKDYMKEI